MIDYEKARQQTIARQPMYLEAARALIHRGAALCSNEGEEHDYVVIAPWSRIEPGLIEYQEFTSDGAGKVRRMPFEILGMMDWGWFCPYVNGSQVGWLAPVEDLDSEEMIEIWRRWSSTPAPAEFALKS